MVRYTEVTRNTYRSNRRRLQISIPPIPDHSSTHHQTTRIWEVERIPVGIWPGGTVFEPSGDRAFVANNKTNDVSVIDADSFEETEHFETAYYPDGITYRAD